MKKTRCSCNEFLMRLSCCGEHHNRHLMLGGLERLMERKCLKMAQVEGLEELEQLELEHRTTVGVELVDSSVVVADYNCYVVVELGGESSSVEPVIDSSVAEGVHSFAVVELVDIERVVADIGPVELVGIERVVVDIGLVEPGVEHMFVELVDSFVGSSVVGVVDRIAADTMAVDNSVGCMIVDRMMVESIHKIELHSFGHHKIRHSLVESKNCHKMIHSLVESKNYHKMIHKSLESSLNHIHSIHKNCHSSVESMKIRIRFGRIRFGRIRFDRIHLIHKNCHSSVVSMKIHIRLIHIRLIHIRLIHNRLIHNRHMS